MELGAIPAARQGGRQLRVSDMSSSPIVAWYDPGETTGWSVIQVHPLALVDPEIKILDNIEYWAHGQINCKSRKGLPETRDIYDGNGRLEYVDLAADLGGELEGAQEMLHIFDQFPGAAAGIEDFIPRQLNQDRSFLSPVRMTAYFDYGLFTRGFQSFRQQPSEAKGIASNDRLQAWGLYMRDGQEHARDADRHSIVWLRKCSTRKKLREASWPHLYGKIKVLNKLETELTKKPVYDEVTGPYFIPDGMTWAEVEEAEAESLDSSQPAEKAG